MSDLKRYYLDRGSNDHSGQMLRRADGKWTPYDEAERALLQARADAAAAVALAYEAAAEFVGNEAPSFPDNVAWCVEDLAKAVRALAPAEGIAELAKLRERAEKAEQERVAEWNRRRDADGSRDAARAACDTMRAERDTLAAEVARLKAQEAGEEGDLNSRLKSHGLLTIDEVMQPFNRFQVHAGMTDLAFFEVWLERKAREYATMRARYEIGEKDKSDDLYEWVLAHSGAYHDVLVNLRAALAAPPADEVRG